ncbi:hypothetical protein [Gracilinema caldarium]|uniref:Protein BatD n=1 Tax=Gracilinema caldarium (strain ATCC 51460 / DSM 7334 / H1) TaxID=744872 RepID=F8F3X1_GRAC1|nr:hypothetical protein [Gracilinema caldarium]AEJ20490.1 hypothetical protein Spica_2380 [Gracilinema caldarium DSM 7334]
MKRFKFINLVLLLFPVFLFSDTPGKSTGSVNSDTLSVVQVPPQVFVGDNAQLVLTMVPNASVGSKTITVDVVDKLPQSKAVQISRIELDPHGKNPKISIDFVAFEPGRIPLPSFEIGPYLITKQAIDVTSVLEGGQAGLETAPLEEPLLIPGSRLLLYSIIAGAVLLAALLLTGLIWGSAWYRNVQTWFRKRQVSRNLKQTLLHIEQGIAQGRNPTSDELGTLLVLLRTYIEQVIAFPCLTKTSQELLAEAGSSPFKNLILRFANLVASLDVLRFSGRIVKSLELKQLCADSRELILLMEREDIHKSQLVSGVLKRSHVLKPRENPLGGKG